MEELKKYYICYLPETLRENSLMFAHKLSFTVHDSPTDDRAETRCVVENILSNQERGFHVESHLSAFLLNICNF